MKVSYSWLQEKFFDGKLPAISRVEEALTFHSWEVEEIIEKDGDIMIDVKVLPDKTPWALSHRGIAKDLSVVLGIPLAHDPLLERAALTPEAQEVSVTVSTPTCDRYIAAYVRGVTVGPSPLWLQKYLGTLGQRSINNIVDATNYVMFHLGQPLHAFDAQKLKGLSIGVRAAREGETIVTLTGETYTLSQRDALIVDGVSDEPLGIAGVKGGKVAEVDSTTTDLIIESAHFDRVAIRKTSQRLKLRTDASARYENGLVPDLTAYAMRDVVTLIVAIAGGECVGFVDTGSEAEAHPPVSLSLSRLGSVLGRTLSHEEVGTIMGRFGYPHTWEGETLTVHPPFERTDLSIAEDLIEEIGRVHGYLDVPSVPPDRVLLTEYNKVFFYTDKIRTALMECGFSEIFTSSFRAKDELALRNAFASDKGFLRSELTKNMDEALTRNAPNADLLGVREVRAFEIGTVFRAEGEHLSLALGVRSPGGYKAKNDERVVEQGIQAVEHVLGTSLTWTKANGIAEASLAPALELLPAPTAYAPFEKVPDITYKPFSNYPFASRDVAFWSAEGVTAETAEGLIRTHAGDLLQRLDLFDQFEKEGKTSLAFRLVFQSYEKTLTEEEITAAMEQVYTALKEAGCEIR